MAQLTIDTIDRAGLDLEAQLVAADVAGDKFANTGKEFLAVKNADATPKTVTIVTHQTVDGLAIPDRDVVVPDGDTMLIGPFPSGIYNDSENNVVLSYSAVTNVTVGVLKLATN